MTAKKEKKRFWHVRLIVTDRPAPGERLMTKTQIEKLLADRDLGVAGMHVSVRLVEEAD